MDDDNGRNQFEIVLVKPVINGDKSVRNEKGQFGPGNLANPKGRPIGAKNYLNLIEDALRAEAEKSGYTFWQKLAEWAMTNQMSGFALLKKFVPDKQFTEIVGLEPIKFEVEILDGDTKSTNE